MAVTFQDVVRQLDREEPNYTQAAQLGPEALPHLRQIVQGNDPGLASKAAFLAGSISGPTTIQILEIAAHHSDPVVRVAAAASAANIKDLSPALATTFLQDKDPGVRKWGLRTLEVSKPEGLKATVQKMLTDDPDPELRDQARRVLDQLK